MFLLCIYSVFYYYHYCCFCIPFKKKEHIRKYAICYYHLINHLIVMCVKLPVYLHSHIKQKNTFCGVGSSS